LYAFLGEKLPDWKAAAALVRKIAKNYKLPYYTMSPTYSVCRDHGYLTGEQSVCPICGKPTEVYSRITGYYRPVQNWNDGKAQEFKDRMVYNIGRSRLTHIGPVKKEAPVSDEASKAAQDGVMLFKTATCPNCKIAASLLNQAGIEFTPVDAEENPDMAMQFDIMQAPTLVVKHGNNIEKYVGVSDIRGWMATQK